MLIFNGARVLVAIVRSLHCAAELTHENKSAIHNCCTGKSVRSGAYYYRQLHPDILLEMDDLDKLTLKEYDDLCGVKRKYISTRKMAHIRQRAAWDLLIAKACECRLFNEGIMHISQDYAQEMRL